MRLCFSGLENPIEIDQGIVSVLEVHNKTLYSRLLMSLCSGEGENALEPYSIWKDGQEVKSSEGFLIVENPMNLPWEHRLLEGKLHEKVEQAFFLEDNARIAFESIGRELFSSIANIGFSFNGEYTFNTEWDFRRCLKAFSFAPDFSNCNSLLDKLILFIDFAADMGIDRPLLFINLKTFLDASSIDLLYERIFLQKISVLLAESALDQTQHQYERKLVVDQHFCEVIQTDCPSSAQGGLCSNGFGAVAF